MRYWLTWLKNVLGFKTKAPRPAAAVHRHEVEGLMFYADMTDEAIEALFVMAVALVNDGLGKEGFGIIKAEELAEIVARGRARGQQQFRAGIQTGRVQVLAALRKAAAKHPGRVDILNAVAEEIEHLSRETPIVAGDLKDMQPKGISDASN
ncbi:MAG: hypothetical protein AB7H77_09305 [Bdellovibrionales bacterium]